MHVNHIQKSDTKIYSIIIKMADYWPILTRFHGIRGVGRCIPPACCRCSCIIYFTPPGTGFIWLTPGRRTIIWSRWCAFAPDCTKKRIFIMDSLRTVHWHSAQQHQKTYCFCFSGVAHAIKKRKLGLLSCKHYTQGRDLTLSSRNEKEEDLHFRNAMKNNIIIVSS